MLLLLPPSETKREGGVADSRLELGALRFATELGDQRAAALERLSQLAANPDIAIPALALGPTQHGELQRNREVYSSPLLPALERYTGVLFDALDPRSLSDDARVFAAEHMLIHSALFGLVSAADGIPAYRLSHNSRLPGLSLRRLWRAPIAGLLAQHPGLILDLRSEAYAVLGPLSGASNAIYLRVVSEGADGTTRALSHFNKAGKGRFTRALLEAGVNLESGDELHAWAESAGFRTHNGRDGEINLVV